MVSQKIVTSFEMLTPRGWSVIGYRAVAVFFFFFFKDRSGNISVAIWIAQLVGLAS